MSRVLAEWEEPKTASLLWSEASPRRRVYNVAYIATLSALAVLAFIGGYGALASALWAFLALRAAQRYGVIRPRARCRLTDEAIETREYFLTDTARWQDYRVLRIAFASRYAAFRSRLLRSTKA